MISPTEKAPDLWFSLLMIVAYESSTRGPMLVASSASGNEVVAIDDGSDDLVSTGGVQSEQNMLRAASGPPSLVCTGVAGVSAFGATTAIFGPCSGSPRYFASTMWLVALAANTAQIITTTAPRTQK